MNQPLQHPERNETTTLRELIMKYVRYWYLFVLGVVVALVISKVYLRYAENVYNTVGTIIIKEDRNNRSIDLSNFSNFRSFFSSYNGGRLNNEIAILKSNRLISKTIDNLNLNVSYASEGNLKTSSLYRFKPIEVKFINFKENFKNKGIPKLYFEILSLTEYKLTNDSGSISEVHAFGEQVSLPYCDFIVIPDYEDPEVFKQHIGLLISMVYQSTDKLANSFKSRLNVDNSVENSNVVTISMNTVNPERTEDFINELIEQYNKDAREDKGMVAQKTSEFIADRLQIIEQELDSVERDKVVFKSDNRIVDIPSEAEISLAGAFEFDKQQTAVETKIELARTVIDYIEKSEPSSLLPENIGFDQDEVGTAIIAHNELVLQRSKLLKSSTEQNPVIISLDDQIDVLRNNIVSGLANTRSALEIELRNVASKGYRIDSELRQIPQKEKVYRGIERQQNIKEQLYLFLLQQREEASLSLAATSTKAKVVDFVYTSKSPIAPNRQFVTMLALFAGLLVPFAFLYGRFLLNNKVVERGDVERILGNHMFLGELPRIGKGQRELIESNDRTILAECFRILRTNLQYYNTNSKDSGHGKTIFVTSSVKGEGKTMVAFNLALAMSFTGKKVVIVGADIRNPQLGRYLTEDRSELRSHTGITEYLIREETTADDLIIKGAYKDANLDVVISGAIPPNPAELLMQPRTRELFAALKEKYDYVIVDTAPCMLVTDTIIINNLADVTLYVIRAHYTDKKILEFPKDAIADGRLSRVAFVLNAVKTLNFGYGNKYGYTYAFGNEKKSLLQRLFKR